MFVLMVSISFGDLQNFLKLSIHMCLVYVFVLNLGRCDILVSEHSHINIFV